VCFCYLRESWNISWKIGFREDPTSLSGGAKHCTRKNPAPAFVANSNLPKRHLVELSICAFAASIAHDSGICLEACHREMLICFLFLISSSRRKSVLGWRIVLGNWEIYELSQSILNLSPKMSASGRSQQAPRHVPPAPWIKMSISARIFWSWHIEGPQSFFIRSRQ